MTDIAAAPEFARLPGVSEPRFWTGTPSVDPDRYTLDASRYGDPLSSSGVLAKQMRATFDEVGLVHVVNTGLGDLASQRIVARHVLGDQMKYEGGSNPRRAIEPNVYEIGAPLEAWLHYHHEMAYIGQSTRSVAFLCEHTLPDGRGDTYVSDGVASTEALLATPFGQRLKEKGVRYYRSLTDRRSFEGRIEEGVYNHWQLSLGTEDPAVAERRAQERGLTTAWGPDGMLQTWYTVSAFEFTPEVGRNLLFSSVADHSTWFDAWPLVQHLPRDRRPLDMTYGDGTPFTPDEVDQFIDVYADHGQPIPWQPGDVAVICNFRWAHGRPAIHLGPGEKRNLGVLLGPSFDRLGALPGGW